VISVVTQANEIAGILKSRDCLVGARAKRAVTLQPVRGTCVGVEVRTDAADDIVVCNRPEQDATHALGSSMPVNTGFFWNKKSER
jgi:hypothetical protein